LKQNRGRGERAKRRRGEVEKGRRGEVAKRRRGETRKPQDLNVRNYNITIRCI
jgi:hypothetical protein